MDFVTYLQATEITGKNKRTIQRSVSSGKLSYTTQDVDGKEVKLFNKVELVALHGQVSPVSPIPAPLTGVTHVDNINYDEISNSISNAIVMAQQPLIEQLSDLVSLVKGEVLTPKFDYETIAETISKSILEAQQPLLDKISSLTAQIEDLTHKSGKTKEEPEKTAETSVDEPVFLQKDEIPNYLDDIPTFGSRKF